MLHGDRRDPSNTWLKPCEVRVRNNALRSRSGVWPILAVLEGFLCCPRQMGEVEAPTNAMKAEKSSALLQNDAHVNFNVDRRASKTGPPVSGPCLRPRA